MLTNTANQIEPNLFILVDFKVIQERYAGIFEIFFFFPFHGCPKFKILSKIEKKTTKMLTLKRPRKIYLLLCVLLYHLEIYLYEQIWINSTCKSSKFGQFTWKFDIFCTQCDFSYISYDLQKYCDNMKSFDNWALNDSILKWRSIGGQHM